MFGLKDSDRILDLGCGDGLDIQILKRFGLKDVVGLDVSSYLISLAGKLNPGVEFYLGAAQKMPFKDESFDVILVDAVFEHLIDKKDSIKEMKRVLKRKGKLCFIEPHESFLRQIFDFITFSPASSLMGPLKGRREAYLAEKERINYWLRNEKNFYDFLKGEGFREIFYTTDLLTSVGSFAKIS